MSFLFLRPNKFVDMLMVLLVCACSGCASLGTYNPATGRNEFIFISTPEEVALGNDVHQKLQSEFEFSDQTVKLPAAFKEFSGTLVIGQIKVIL